MLQRGPSTKGAVHGRLVVPCKYLYRPSRCRFTHHLRCEHQPCRCSYTTPVWGFSGYSCLLGLSEHHVCQPYVSGWISPLGCLFRETKAWNILNTSLVGSKGLYPAAGTWGWSQSVGGKHGVSWTETQNSWWELALAISTCQTAKLQHTQRRPWSSRGDKVLQLVQSSQYRTRLKTQRKLKLRGGGAAWWWGTAFRHSVLWCVMEIRDSKNTAREWKHISFAFFWSETLSLVKCVERCSLHIVTNFMMRRNKLLFFHNPA